MKTNSKGAWLYGIKKNGERYAKPSFYEFFGLEKTAEDIKSRLEELNPGSRWEISNDINLAIR